MVPEAKRELGIEEAKQIELEILLHIDKICKENKLRYFLAYGTLIGAVRHKGFIPWDDDVDINMPREDYDWLIANYNKMYPNGRYKLISPFSKESRHSFVKFVDQNTLKIEPGFDYKDGYLGIDVDIFPLDGEPDDEKAFNKWYYKLMRVYKVYSLCRKSKHSTLKRKIGVPLLKIFMGNWERQLKKAEKLHKMYPYAEANFIGAVECLYNSRGNRYKKEWYAESVEVEFEGHMLPIPCGYDAVLRKMYGDYMRLPPVEQQVTHHTNKMYLLARGEKDEKI